MNTLTKEQGERTPEEQNDNRLTAYTTFHINSDEAANWLLRKLANIEAEKARVKSQAETMLRQLDGDAEGLRFLYESELQEFVRQKLAASGARRKSVAFLQGTCAFRTAPASVKITDPKAALDYAREHLSLFVHTQTVETLDTAAYRIYADDRDLPGTERVPERETFSLRFGKSED
jgi:hypothetical protein